MSVERNLAPFLDFANHHNSCTHADVTELCNKVLKYGFNSAFVNPYFIKFAKEEMKGAAKVGTVISFPLGQELTLIKVAAAAAAIKEGADEIDVCLNVALIKEGLWDESFSEMKAVVSGARNIRSDIIIKFIPEVGLLTDEEIKKVAVLIADSGADFFKTGSGSVGGTRGPEIKDIQLVREVVGRRLKIKVVGGIRNYEKALSFIEAGADRIGTSHAVEIVEGTGGDRESSGE